MKDETARDQSRSGGLGGGFRRSSVFPAHEKDDEDFGEKGQESVGQHWPNGRLGIGGSEVDAVPGSYPRSNACFAVKSIPNEKGEGQELALDKRYCISLVPPLLENDGPFTVFVFRGNQNTV